VKATVAHHIAEQRPAEARAALATIERTGRSALTEIRRVLEVHGEDLVRLPRAVALDQHGARPQRQ